MKTTTNIFTVSKEMKPEYCAQVVRIGEMKPIEGSTFLAEVLVSGTPMVVRKDEFKTGDYAIYCKNETILNKDFLSVNNLFESSEFMKNANYEKVIELKNKYHELMTKLNKTEEDISKMAEIEARIKSSVGFFNKYGRVKAIKLRGVVSYGFLIKTETLSKWKPEIKDVDLSKFILNEEMGIGIDFDTICNEKFIDVYVPVVKEKPTRSVAKMDKKRQKKVERFERINSEDFKFHYSTKQLNDNIWRIQPTDIVTITTKRHGTSGVFSCIPVKTPIKLSLINRFWNYLFKKSKKYKYANNLLINKVVPDYKIEYGNVYSSRGVIKNQYINKNVTPGFYGTDIWCEVNELIKPYIDEGMTIYGEICGYLPNSDKMIQKGYDYGCKKGEWYFMPYRITTIESDNTVREWEVTEVCEWTLKLLENHPNLSNKMHVIDILYHGTLSDLYPEISMQNHWHENILQALRKEKRFYMEEYDPDCKNRVPFEGVVLRIKNDPTAEAFKLKTELFRKKERSDIDKGQVDIEMTNTYENN